MDSSVSPKDEIWFLRVCHHISNAVYTRRPVRPYISKKGSSVHFFLHIFGRRWFHHLPQEMFILSLVDGYVFIETVWRLIRVALKKFAVFGNFIRFCSYGFIFSSHVSNIPFLPPSFFNFPSHISNIPLLPSSCFNFPSHISKIPLLPSFCFNLSSHVSKIPLLPSSCFSFSSHISNIALLPSFCFSFSSHISKTPLLPQRLLYCLLMWDLQPLTQAAV